MRYGASVIKQRLGLIGSGSEARESPRARREAVVDAQIEAEAVKHDVAAALDNVSTSPIQVLATRLIAAVPFNGLLGAFPDL